MNGALNGEPNDQSDIVPVIGDNCGELDWKVYFADRETENTYLHMLPALVVPGWLTARELPDAIVENGLVATGGRSFNATATISFPSPSEDQLEIEIVSEGLSKQGEKNIIDYSIQLSGSYPALLWIIQAAADRAPAGRCGAGF